MKVKTEPLLGSAMFGIVIQLIFYFIFVAGTHSFLLQVANGSLDPFDRSFTPSNTPFGNFIGPLFCLVLSSGSFGSGMLYVALHSQKELLTSNIAIKGGAASGALACAVAGLVLMILNSVLIVPLMNDVLIQMATVPGSENLDPTSIGNEAFRAFLPYIAVVFTCSITFMVVVGGLIGACGGGIGRAFVRRGT